MALKCADLGHASASWELHSRWVKALEEEMFLQVSLPASAKPLQTAAFHIKIHDSFENLYKSCCLQDAHHFLQIAIILEGFVYAGQ